MPRTGTTGFDEVGRERFTTSLESLEFGTCGDATTVPRQARPEHVGDEHKMVLGADGTRSAGGGSQLTRCPHEFGMGVAHLISTQSATVVLVDEVTPCQTMVDGPRPVHRPLQRLLAERHADAR